MMAQQIASRPGAGYEMYPIGCLSIKQQPARPGMNAVTGTASGAARVPDQAVCVPSRPRRAIPYW
jgi:hypothetical protein